MKRATLTAYSTPQPAQPADLTDRLLEQEAGPAAKSADQPGRRRRQTSTKRQATAADKPAASSEAAVRPEASGPPTPAMPASDSLAAALAAVAVAAEALRQASGDAPARYDVALRYRLDALAHHLQQVKEFVASLAAR